MDPRIALDQVHSTLRKAIEHRPRAKSVNDVGQHEPATRPQAASASGIPDELSADATGGKLDAPLMSAPNLESGAATDDWLMKSKTEKLIATLKREEATTMKLRRRVEELQAQLVESRSEHRRVVNEKLAQNERMDQMQYEIKGLSFQLAALRSPASPTTAGSSLASPSTEDVRRQSNYQQLLEYNERKIKSMQTKIEKLHGNCAAMTNLVVGRIETLRNEQNGLAMDARGAMDALGDLLEDAQQQLMERLGHAHPPEAVLRDAEDHVADRHVTTIESVACALAEAYNHIIEVARVHKRPVECPTARPGGASNGAWAQELLQFLFGLTRSFSDAGALLRNAILEDETKQHAREIQQLEQEQAELQVSDAN